MRRSDLGVPSIFKAVPLSVSVAIIAALAMVGALSLFSFATIQAVQASIEDNVQFDPAGVGVGKHTEPLKTPLQFSATSVLTGTASHNPIRPGVAATYIFSFINGASALRNAVDEITITFDDEYGVPPTIDRNQITVSASAVVGGAGGIPNQAVSPLEVSVDFVGPEQDEPEITLRVPDMDPSDNPFSFGNQDIAAGAMVTIVFRLGAGITNPTDSGADRIDLRTTQDQDDVELRNRSAEALAVDPNGLRVFTPLIVEIGSSGDPRGASLTLTALGVEGRHTATFWLDVNGDSVRQPTERDLCNVVATREDVAVCDFTVSNPPFIPGKFAALVDSTAEINDAGGISATDTVVAVTSPTPFNVGRVIQIDDELMLITGIAGSVLSVERAVLGTSAATHADTTSIFTVDVNFINVVDIKARTTTGVLNNSAPYTGFELSRQSFELQPTIFVSPSGAINVGDRVTISLFDYPAGALTAIEIGGQDVTPAGFNKSVPSGGGLSFSFTIPATASNGASIPTGTQRIEVFGAGGVSQDASITIGGARITLSHDSIVANQDLVMTGSGFTEGNDVCVVEGDVTINNVAVEIDDNSDCPGNVLARAGADEGILLSSGGTFTLTVWVHDADIGAIPINTALLSEGSAELKVIDTNGAEGTVQVTIAERTLGVVPPSARPRDIVTIVGRAFVANNADGVPTSVNIEYFCGSDSRSVTADPDSRGNFREPLRIPSNCSIPSTNTITATINVNGDTGVVETITHEIPDALVRVTPSQGSPGDRVTVSGEGFRTFETVERIEFGGRGVLGGRVVNTDASGDFTVDDIVVPGLDPGIHAVLVEVGTGDNRTTTGSTSFEVITPTPPANIGVDPWSFNLSLAQGESDVQILGVSNDGEVLLEFDIDVVDTTSLSFAPSSAFETIQHDGWGESAEELAGRREGSSSYSPLAPVASPEVPAVNLVTVLSDPEGDATGAAPLVDILGVDAGFDQDMLTLSALFSSATDMNNLVGYIHLDTDQDPATGFPPAAQFGNANQDLGADYFLNLFSLPSLGVIGVFDQNSNFITDVVPILQDQSLRVSIPLSALGGDDGQVNLSLVLGNNRGPTDWAPDSGHARVGPVEWLTVTPSSGRVAGGGTAVVAVIFDATNLGPGVYTANLVVQSNDPVQSTLAVPVTLTLTSSNVIVPSLKLHQDPADGAAGIVAQLPPIIDPSSGAAPTILLGNFRAKLTYDVDCLNIVDVRKFDFNITDLNIDNLNGTTTFNGRSDAGVPPTADLAHALTRLVGSNQQLCTLTVEIAKLTDPTGTRLDVMPQPGTIDFLRGDARADGVIDIADAIFILQYLVGSLNACTREGDTTCLNAVNAAGVHQDGGPDKLTIDDALFITEYLAGLRDEFYNPLP